MAIGSLDVPDTTIDPLHGKTALVTGASRGIGAAVARALTRYGTRVAIVARREEALRALAEQLGTGTVVAPCDVTSSDAVRQMSERVTDVFGGAPDILVNNAAVFRIAPLAEMSEELFLETIQTNLIAPFFVVRAFLPAMRQRASGDVITVGSIADRYIMAENGAYSPAKFGLRAMHEVLRAETKGSGIRATLIAPGPTDTSIWDEVLADEHTRALPTRAVMLSVDAVADAIVYVVSRPAAVNIDELRLSHS